MIPDWVETTAALAGTGGAGAAVFKLCQLWLAHRRSVDGTYNERSAVAKDHLQSLLDALTAQVASLLARTVYLETAERECRDSTVLLRKEHEAKNHDLRKEIHGLRNDMQVLISTAENKRRNEE